MLTFMSARHTRRHRLRRVSLFGRLLTAHIKEFNQYALLNTPDLPVMPGFMA